MYNAGWCRCAAGGAFPARLLVACLVPTARMVAMTGTKAKTERAVRYVLQLLRVRKIQWHHHWRWTVIFVVMYFFGVCRRVLTVRLPQCAAERHQALDWQVQALAQALGALGAAGDPNLPVAGVKALTAALGKVRAAWLACAPSLDATNRR